MIAIRALRHEPIESDVQLPVVVVTRANAQAYETPVADRTCPAWQDVVRR